jgi:triacylglycerol esterase/lipase EstA (alpha/beta hydrolase family)
MTPATRLAFVAIMLAAGTPACQSLSGRPVSSDPALRADLARADRALRESRRASGRTEAAAFALHAAEIAWDLDWRVGGEVIRHANRRAARVYDSAIARLLELSRDPRELDEAVGRELAVAGPHGTYGLTIAPETQAALAAYPELEPASAYKGRGGFKRRIARDGVGLTLVGINKDFNPIPLLPATGDGGFKRRAGYTAPRTALLLFDKPVPPGATRKVSLGIIDPREVETVKIGSRSLPVAADLTAPLMAAYPEFGNVFAAIGAAITPDSWFKRSTIYALEVYDPRRIPVVLVHGLFSTPDMWKDLVNELNATPGIGNRFQFYVFTYPTGVAPIYSAGMLRGKIRRIQERNPLDQGYVLLGHSMGGILSRLQATDSGRVVWDEVFGEHAAEAWKKSVPGGPVRQTLVFDADPMVRRLIYVCVPHRGSPVASSSPVRFISRLAGMPFELTEKVATSPLRALGLLPERMPTSADGLSPDSKVLRAMDKLPANAPAHSIIGNRGRPGPLEQSSDGIVPYWSSHQASALTELVVPADHGAYKHPEAVAEIKRLLLLDAAGPARAGRK